VFNKSVYVFAHPEALQAAEKHHKNIINDELFVRGSSQLFLWSKRQHDIALIHLRDPHAAIPSLLKTVRPALRDSLRPGINLDEIGFRYQKEFGRHVNSLAYNGPEKIFLWEWIRRTMTLGAGLATFGSKHPFVVNPSLQADFWAVEKENLKLIFYPLPSLFLRKGFKARERVLAAMTQYAEGDGIDEASAFVKAYHKVLEQYNLTKEELGSFDATVLTAFIGSLIPLGFWALCFILSRPDLVTKVRAEVDKCIVHRQELYSMDMDKLRANCPVLLAALREAGRMAMQAPLFRSITEDTRITIPSKGETYLMKKGSLAMIAVSCVHANEKAWGKDVASFDEARFLPPKDTISAMQAGDNQNVKADPDIARPAHFDAYTRSAFSPFATGVHLCPGRHYAQTVIMTTIALFLATFDASPIHGDNISIPPMKPELGLGAGKPTEDVEVEISRRTGFESVHWGFEG
jgi:cytochrome P450